MVTRKRKGLGRFDPVPRTQKVIYAHGANGSGKTTLARVLIACAGGPMEMAKCPTGAVLTHTRKYLVLVGPYRTATGGADSVQPYALVPKTIHHSLVQGYSVFCEGLMTPGVETCRQIWASSVKLRVDVTFLLLDVPIDECIAHVQARRDRKGNDKPYDPELLVKKHRSSSNWIENLKAAGLPTQKLPWKAARDFCLHAYNLSAEGADPWAK